MTDDALVMERTFDAPVALLWQMWTDAEHFKAWYGPDGATIPLATIDAQVGGQRLVCMEMQTPDGPMQMWFAGEHLEVVEPVRLVYTEAMADEAGNPTSPATEVSVVLEPVDGGTRMVLTHRGIAADSPGATGWAMALDKLAARVAAH